MAEPIASTQPLSPETDSRAGRGPRRLRAYSGLTIIVGLLLAGWQFAYWEPRLLPVRVIEVQGELHHHSSQQLQKTIGERLRGGILTADLEDLKQAALGVAWVGGASIRRVWPDRLQVRVSEHQPVARWNGSSLVTAEGQVFDPRARTVPAGLARLEGDDQRAPEAVRRYLQWRDDLMLAGQIIESLSVDARGAWRLGLASGIQLELGSTKEEERLGRFLASVVQLEAAGQPKLVDLRYSNGFSVVWRRNAPVADAVVSTAPKPQTTKAVSVKRGGQKVTSNKTKVKTKAKSQTAAAKVGKGAKPSSSTKATDKAVSKPTAKARTSGKTAPIKSPVTTTKPAKVKEAPVAGAKTGQKG